jgi:putative nucleotidyltransferase with HDIG domain
MKRVVTKKLTPGMVLANDVYTHDSNIKLMDKGTILEDKDIARLAFYSIIDVLVEEERVRPLYEELFDESAPSYSERLRQSDEFKAFKADFEECAAKFEHEIKNIINHDSTFNIDNMVAPIYELLKKGRSSTNIFEMLNNLRTYDDATYTHCINVALITNIMGQWLKWDEDEIAIATQAGLFHDIGKLMIPDSIITKPGKLTSDEYSIVQTHPQRGYDILQPINVSSHVKNAALMHHEKCDGTGYPQKLKGPQIDRFAKAVAIADVYDAMTSARHYRGPLCPFIAISMLEEEGLQKYDPEIIMVFLQNIVNTYLLNRVKLNTGEVGEIIFINKSHLSKPTIKVGDDYIDLSKLTGVYIQEIL